MTLPASGTITMGMVKAELGIAGTTLTLTDSRVRALFGKTSGAIIKLTDGYSKSNIRAWRPTSVSYLGTMPTNPTNAYDTPAIPNSVDTSSWTTLNTSSNVRSTQTYTFGSGGSVGGTLYIRVKNISVTYAASDDGNEAESTASISVALNGTDFSTLGSWEGTLHDDIADTTFTLAVPNGTALANVIVKIQSRSERRGTGMSMVIAPVTCNIADIVIY